MVIKTAIKLTQEMNIILGRILPFSITQSQEKLTDRGNLALIDEFMIGLGFTRQLHQVFPAPRNGKGIKVTDHVRTHVYHFADGVSHPEEIKHDRGLRSLIKMDHMPKSDEVGYLA